MTNPPRVHYAKSGDVNIAYRVSGDGPLNVVFVPAGFGVLDMWWEEPFSGFRERLERFCRLIILDKRGMGLSDRVPGLSTLEDRMDDVRAVLDATSVERATLLGASEGGPVTCLFAATYPDRVSGLLLLGAIAKWSQAPDWPCGLSDETSELWHSYIEQYWGSGRALDMFAPSLAGNRGVQQQVGRIERLSGTPGSIADTQATTRLIDVRPVLPTISAPTLIMHRAQDQVVPVEHGRYLASHIPGARIVELAGQDHWPVGQVDDIVGEIEEFLTGARHAPTPDRVLTTVLFTDIVDSTRRAVELGDREWRALLDRHDVLVRQNLERFSGREINTTGDGFFASFDGPARAIRCGQAIVAAVSAIGLDVRAGLHTGECEVRGDDLAGVAVHIAARVAAHAAAGEVVVSGSVPPLVAGSGIGFADRGEHELKGVPGPWRIWSAVT